jgi:two-component system, OmpR family, sensor kinase
MNTGRRRLVLRVYAFAAIMSIMIMAALLVLPRYIKGARYLEPQAALLQYMVDRWSSKQPVELEVSMARIEPRLRGNITLFSHEGRLLRTLGEPVSPPTRDEKTSLKQGKWALSTGRIIVRSDDGSLIAVYHPNRPTYPWGLVLPMCAGMLLLVGAASFWFARRLARPLEQLAAAARDFGDGNTTARAKLARDDELGNVGKAFDEMADRTAIVMAAQRQLMADVSHELRTPLARIRVALEIAVEDPDGAKDVLLDVGTDLDEIDQLIADILTTARLDGENALVERRPARLDDIVQQAAKRFLARHPNRTLETPLVEESVIDCDPLLLRRAIDNLLDNAAKYSEIGTPVRLAVITTGQHVEFEISDRGVGMSCDELERAFTPFWRADGSRTRKTGGVGLGLALARRIARAHGGDVRLESVPGQGTKAKLDVPLAS